MCVGRGSDKTSCEPSSIDTRAAVKIQADMMEAWGEDEEEQRRQMSRERLGRTSERERHMSKRVEDGNGQDRTE